MTWDGADAEGLAKWIYDAAGFDMADPPGPVRLAKALEIDVKTAPRRHLWGHGTKVRIQGRRVIYVAPKLAPEHHAFAVAHEIAEWQLDGREDDETEGLCDAVAAALIAPAPAFRWMLDDHGPDLITLAEGFSTTQSCVALRLGEVTGRPMALVSPRLVRVRGDDWGWPAEDEIRRLSRARSLPTELTAVRLTDDPRRVFLQAALAQQLKRSILFACVDRHSYTYLTNRRRGPRRSGRPNDRLRNRSLRI